MENKIKSIDVKINYWGGLSRYFTVATPNPLDGEAVKWDIGIPNEARVHSEPVEVVLTIKDCRPVKVTEHKAEE